MELHGGWGWQAEVFLSFAGAPGLVFGDTQRIGELFEQNRTSVLQRMK